MKNKAHNTLAAIASAWNDSPRSIISLRDMIEFSASKLVNGLHLLEQHESKAEKLSHQNGGGSRPNEDQSGDLIENCLNPLLGFCEAVGLEKTSDRISELIIQLSGGLGRCGTCSQDMILSGIFAVRMILHEELGRRKFVALALGNDKYFEQAALFGKAVNRAFPSAVEDIRDAGGFRDHRPYPLPARLA